MRPADFNQATNHLYGVAHNIGRTGQEQRILTTALDAAQEEAKGKDDVPREALRAMMKVLVEHLDEILD